MTPDDRRLDARTPPDYAAPNWETVGRVHDWRNYISDQLRAMWQTFTNEQKAAIAQSAESTADGEEWD